jgi:hypothetical protein
MRSLALLLVTLAASGCRLKFDEMSGAADLEPDGIIEVGSFLLLLCVGPTAETCPPNVVVLATANGWVAGQLRFFASPSPTEPQTDLAISDLQVEPGPDGVYLEDPQFSWSTGLSEAFLGVTLNLAPGAPAQLVGDGTVALTGFLTEPVTLRFGALGPYRAETTAP